LVRNGAPIARHPTWFGATPTPATTPPISFVSNSGSKLVNHSRSRLKHTRIRGYTTLAVRSVPAYDQDKANIDFCHFFKQFSSEISPNPARRGDGKMAGKGGTSDSCAAPRKNQPVEIPGTMRFGEPPRNRDAVTARMTASAGVTDNPTRVTRPPSKPAAGDPVTSAGAAVLVLLHRATSSAVVVAYTSEIALVTGGAERSVLG